MDRENQIYGGVMDLLDTLMGIFLFLGVMMLIGILLWGALYEPKKT